MPGLSKELTLVLLAAGMGSRYGGLKQLDPFGPHGETLMDYSVYDALRAGFTRVVFVIRRDFEAAFSAQVASKYAGRIKVALAFQSLDGLPAGFSVPPGREKPWGTGQALLAAADLLDGPFAVCNADDFYGREAYAALSACLSQVKAGEGALVSFRLGATLSDYGTVSRGVCQVKDGWLQDVTEHPRLKAEGAGVRDLDKAAEPLLSLETPVSLNFWGFHPSALAPFQAGFTDFLKQLAEPLRSEYYLPAAVMLGMQAGLKVRALPGGQQWFGVTYPQDKPSVQAALQALVEKGHYPTPLW